MTIRTSRAAMAGIRPVPVRAGGCATRMGDREAVAADPAAPAALGSSAQEEQRQAGAIAAQGAGTRVAERRRAAQRVRIVHELVAELFALACQGGLPRGTAERRPRCHIRQISMYLCRVVLSMRYQEIARAIGRDRSTVIHACAVVEDRRDSPAYDAFVDRCERCVRTVFGDGGMADGE